MADNSLIFDGFEGVVIPGTSGDDILIGTAAPETFYLSGDGTGNDVIKNFGKNDILVVDEQIFDSNNDGIIGFGKNKLLDLGDRNGDDTVKFDPNVKGLRYLGTDGDGHFVYADASVRLARFTEGTIGNDALTGTCRSDKFFFDTDLDLNWGTDTISNFGDNDFLVTTSALFDTNGDGRVNFGANRQLDLQGSDNLGHQDDPGAFGLVSITDTSGDTVTDLFFHHSSVVRGVTYYYYSLNAPVNETVSV